jgi:CheY-like chemotaxis protein
MQKLAKVLLVDDDEITIFLNAHLLEQSAVVEELLVARNGLEALQILEKVYDEPATFTEPILVLLDINMPIMNGIEFLETYQQHPLAQKCHLVIIVLTSSKHSRDLERIKVLPVTADIFTKPLTQEMVETILHRHFR